MMIRRLLALLPAAALGCGDATAPSDDLTLATLAGTWTAVAITVTNELDPDLVEDLYDLGMRFQITIETDGAFLVEFSNPLGSDEYGGVLEVGGSSIIMTRDDLDEQLAVDAILNGDVLTLEWEGTEQCGSYDWEADTCPIPVTFALTLER